MHVPHLALRTILSWFLLPFLLRLIPAKLQTRIWHKVHGALLNRAKRPRELREYILCNIILNMVPRLREPASILGFGCSSGALTQRLLHFVDVAQNADTDVVVNGFDTFAGLPEGNPNLDYQKERIAGQGGYWIKGAFGSDKAEVKQNLRKFSFNKFRLIIGLCLRTRSRTIAVSPRSWLGRRYSDCFQGRTRINIFAESDPLRNECQSFLDAVSGTSRPPSDAAEGIRVFKVLDACQLSILQGQAMNLEPS